MKVVHTSGTFSKNIKNIFKTSSYIQKTTTNPINTLKISIHNTKHIQNTQIHLNKSNCFKNKSNIFETLQTIIFGNLKSLLCYISDLHKSYFIYFVYFIFIYLYIYTYTFTNTQTLLRTPL